MLQAAPALQPPMASAQHWYTYLQAGGRGAGQFQLGSYADRLTGKQIGGTNAFGLYPSMLILCKLPHWGWPVVVLPLWMGTQEEPEGQEEVLPAEAFTGWTGHPAGRVAGRRRASATTPDLPGMHAADTLLRNHSVLKASAGKRQLQWTAGERFPGTVWHSRAHLSPFQGC